MLRPDRDGIGVYVWNPVTDELCWDEAMARIFVADRPSEPPFATWLRRVHPDDRDRVIATFSAFGTAEEVYRLVLDDGTTRHILSRTTQVLRGADGEPTGVTGVALDVTESHRDSSRLASMMSSISDGFCALDHHYRFTYVNPRAERVLGMGAEALVGRDLWEVFPHAIDSVFETTYRRVMEQRIPAVLEEFYPDPLNIWIEVRAEPFEEGMVIYFQDVTARRVQQDERELLLRSERQARVQAESARRAAEDAQQQLLHQATHDALTGLLNRPAWEQAAAQRLRERDAPMTALFLDLDRFKFVNDALGHAIGDALLVEVGKRLRHGIRPDDVAARLGGDEFVVLLDGLSPAEAQGVAQRLLEALREPALVEGYRISNTVSIGLARSESCGGEQKTVATLLRDADVALYRAKDAGRDALAWFDEEAHRGLLDRLELEGDLRTAVANGDITLHYQPVFMAGDGRLVGVEALARWHHPERGDIGPTTFIALAEDVGLVEPLGATLIRAAIVQAVAWKHLPDFTVWVNVSGRQLDSSGFAAMLLGELGRAGLETRRFGVEVTESVLCHEDSAVRELTTLSRAGVPIAIDDFGTGYSSLARLAALPISVLKIDKSFVDRIETSQGRASVEAIVNLARALGLRTVAEGVETEHQLDLLRTVGADHAAGFLLGRPAPAAELDC